MWSISRFIYWCWMCMALVSINLFCQGARLPTPDFQSGWMPIRNGLRHIARIDLPHGLNEVPVIVDVAVRDGDNTFPASGFRPDHGVEMSGPVIYIYNDRFINVSTSPYHDRLFQIKPTPTQFSTGERGERSYGAVYVRVRAWKESSLPPASYKTSGFIQARTQSVSDSYKEVRHSPDSDKPIIPCLVVVRAKMTQPVDDVKIYADGVGSSMSYYNNVAGKTNAYLVYGISATHVRLWVDASPNGALFDGRKHTWFDFVIYSGDYEIFTWSCEALAPTYKTRIVTRNTAGVLPPWFSTDTDFLLINSLLRVMVHAEDESGPNKGFMFPASMYLGYPADRSDGYVDINAQIGGLSYTHVNGGQIWLYSPMESNNTRILIASTFGGGRNSESSNTESVYVLSWPIEEDSGCKPPVIYQAIINGFEDVSPVNTSANVECMPGYHLPDDLEMDGIRCDKYGHWVDEPQCTADRKQLGEPCYPSDDACQDPLASCILNEAESDYHCICNKGYKKDISSQYCVKATGTFLPKADFDSGWIGAYSMDINERLEHGLGETPMIVDVNIQVAGTVYPMLSFPPATDYLGPEMSAVYIYDDKFINITGAGKDDTRMISIHNTRWTGWSTQWQHLGKIRARAWKASSLPSPDFTSTSTQLRANSSGSDSFAEVFHQLGEYPGLTQVRAKMVHNGSTFYADGIGSALNVYYDINATNSYLVYGFNNESVRMWVDSSSKGAIFDGRKSSLFNFTVSEATVEISMWKLTTIVPYVSYKFPLHDYDVPNSVDIPPSKTSVEEQIVHRAWIEIDEPESVHYGFRFPGSSYLADRFKDSNFPDDDCAFGGFMYGIESNYFGNNRMDLYKPTNPVDNKYNYVKGAAVCIPKSFGNGQNAGFASNGVGILYGWLDPDCGPPNAITNGHFLTENGTYIGATAVAICDNGYYPFWKRSIKCQHDSNTWSEYPTCKPVSCFMPRPRFYSVMNTTNVTFTYPDSKDTVPFGSTIHFECEHEFVLVGNHTIDCLATGEWSDDPPRCDCRLPNAPNHGNVTFGWLFSTRVINATFACQDNFKLVGRDFMICDARGRWTDKFPTCVSTTSGCSSVSVSGIVFTVQIIIMLMVGI